MNEIKKIEDLTLSLFAPIDQEYPIVEILYNGEVILDLSIDENDPPSIKILIHHGCNGISCSFKIFEKILEKAKEKLFSSL